jgi:hypothetical protein
VDYEAAERNAFAAVFPEAQIQGCLFHYGQALNRNLGMLGLRGLYRQDTPVGHVMRDWIRLHLALPLLPPARVLAIARAIATPPLNLLPLDDQKARQFRLYFERQWLTNPELPIVLWNHYANDGPRTTNHAEGYHSGLNHITGAVHNPSLSSCLTILQKEQEKTATRCYQLLNNPERFPPKPRLPKYVRLDQQLQELRDAFQHDGDSTYCLGYLRRVSNLINYKLYLGLRQDNQPIEERYELDLRALLADV